MHILNNNKEFINFIVYKNKINRITCKKPTNYTNHERVEQVHYRGTS